MLVITLGICLTSCEDSVNASLPENNVWTEASFTMQEVDNSEVKYTISLDRVTFFNVNSNSVPGITISLYSGWNCFIRINSIKDNSGSEVDVNTALGTTGLECGKFYLISGDDAVKRCITSICTQDSDTANLYQLFKAGKSTLGTSVSEIDIMAAIWNQYNSDKSQSLYIPDDVNTKNTSPRSLWGFLDENERDAVKKLFLLYYLNTKQVDFSSL